MNRRSSLTLFAGALLATTLVVALGARRESAAPAVAPGPRNLSPARATSALDQPGFEESTPAPEDSAEGLTREEPGAPRSAVSGSPAPESPLERRLEGIVVDIAGAALADVAVLADVPGAGTRKLETHSDAEGRFVFERWRGGLLRAMRAGYVLDSPIVVVRKALDTDGVTIVMNASGRLTVRAESEAGDPMPGVAVFVDIAQAYGGSAHAQGHSALDGFRVQRATVTDSAGHASFEDMWSGCYLTLALRWNGLERRIDRCEGEELVLVQGTRDGTRVAPIEIAPGESRLFVARLPRVGLVRGQVRYANGASVPEPWIHLYEPEYEPRGLSLGMRGTESGSFELHLPLPRPEEECEFYTLVAQDSQPVDRHSADGGTGSVSAGKAYVDTEELARGPVEVTIVVERLFAISGRVCQADGSRPPSGTRVRAVPFDRDYPGGRSPFREHSTLGFPYREPCRPDGRFELLGLEDGLYEMFVEETLEDSRPGLSGALTGATHEFPAVSAGTSGVKLTLPDEPRTRVIVEAVGPPTVDRAWIFVQRNSTRPRKWSRSAARLHERTVDSLANWPACAPALGFEGWRIGAGPGLVPHEAVGYCFEGAGPYELPPLGPGHYTFGLTAVGPDGRAFPMATGDILRSGELRLSFELQPTGSLRGHISPRPEGPALYIALSDPDGKRMPLFRQDLGGETAEYERRVGRQGGFSLPLVPAGRFRLLVGTKEGLASENYRHVEPIECTPGETTKVQISL